jgi:hypothetical protein
MSSLSASSEGVGDHAYDPWAIEKSDSATSALSCRYSPHGHFLLPTSHPSTTLYNLLEASMKVSLVTTLGSLSLLALSAQASQLRFPSAQQQPITSFSSRLSRVLSHHDNPSLASLKGHDDFTVLQHEQFPNHSVRIKETTSWCDPNTESFTGYLDVGNGKELFFYYFASRSKPDEDPLMMVRVFRTLAWGLQRVEGCFDGFAGHEMLTASSTLPGIPSPR